MFGTRLKILRDKKGISQQDIADIFKYTQSCVGNWERGIHEPNIETIIKLAEYFNVTTDYLLGAEDKSNNNSVPRGSIESAIINEIGSLSNAEKEEILNFIRFKKERK